MRNHIGTFWGVVLLSAILLSTFILVMVGCRSASNTFSATRGWFQPEVRGQAPAWDGNTNPDAFSSSQVVAVPEIPATIPAPTPVSTPNPIPNPATVAPVVPDPFLAVSQAESVPATPLPAPLPEQPVPPQMLPIVQEDHPWSSPTSHHHVEPIPTLASSPASLPVSSPLHSGSPIADPWSFDNPNNIRDAVSIEEQAKREENEMEKARLAELATAQRKNGTPEYLQPLPKWNGPFETRETLQTIEQDIIRQVGYSEEKAKSFDNLPVYDWEKEESKGFDWSVLDPVNFFTKVRDWVGLGPDETKANAAMKKGREILLTTPDLRDRKKCLEAAKQFSEAAKRYPDSLLEEDALHLAGESYFFGEDYTRAMKSYQKLLIKYQHSKHIDNGVRRLFSIARYWEQEDRRGVSSINMTEKSRPTFDTFGYAKKAYETIFINDPNGPKSDDAVMALATAYLLRGRYKGDDNYNHAAYYYHFLRENYPLSRHITQAHEFELEARTKAYMGAEHSSTTLDEAQKLADMTLRQFHSELDEDERDEILDIQETIIHRQAEREWTLGQFYDKKQYYGSAKLYYEKLLDKYPQTDYAEKARVRLEQIQDKPDQPDQFNFIKKIFRLKGT
ncbi:MAG: hypothetical protein LBI18_00255 [Planctomycetaceae bacterium]|jgi:outer membrane protein assembly factor BamD (BamD/ComL family)|nr:hypothetical protein [Planctomycetaceae bacterium]